MINGAPGEMSESDIAKLILQNRRLINLLHSFRKRLVRGQNGRLQDAVEAELTRSQIDEELARSPIAPIQAPIE